jgi:hypothetical protein
MGFFLGESLAIFIGGLLYVEGVRQSGAAIRYEF